MQPDANLRTRCAALAPECRTGPAGSTASTLVNGLTLGEAQHMYVLYLHGTLQLYSESSIPLYLTLNPTSEFMHYCH